MITTYCSLPRIILSMLVLVLSCGFTTAQEIQWRVDYNAARREAIERRLPLLLDFGTEDCFYCKRLDAVTFRVPSVASLMNERFIPLKVDANKDPRLTQALRIGKFPTIVLANFDGKILDVIEGFQDAGPFQEHLTNVLSMMAANTTIVAKPDADASPEATQMMRDYQEAGTAIAAANYARAIQLLKNVLQDGKDRPVQIKARQLLQDMEQQAAGRLAQVKELLNKSQTAEGLEAAHDLVRTFPGTQAATESGQLLTSLSKQTDDLKNQQRTRTARDLLAQAREDHRAKQFLCCLQRCEVLEAQYPDLPEGKAARNLSEDIKSNPERLRQACERMSDQLSRLYLDLAEVCMRKGQPQQAILWLEKVAQTFPGTRNAEVAHIRLSNLQGQPPTQPVDFKKQ